MKFLSIRNLPFLATVGAFVAWFLLLGPSVLGGPATYLWVNGTSMEPTLQNGDLVIVRSADRYGPDDVIGFRVPEGAPGAGALVIHRIVDGSSADGFVMQGDNKARPDRWRPTAEDVVGSVWLTLPGAGTYLVWLRDPMILAPLAAAIAVFLVLVGGGASTVSRPSPRGAAWYRPRALAAAVRRHASSSTLAVMATFMLVTVLSVVQA